MALHGRIPSAIIINSASTIHSTVTSRCYGPTDRRPSNITHFIQPLTRFIYAFKRILFESKYIFLYNTHHFMVFTIDELSVDICPSMSHTSFGLLYLHPPPIYFLPPGSTFLNHIPVTRMSQLTTHAPHIFPYMVLECCHNIRNQSVSTEIPSPNSFCDITSIGTHQHLGKILKYIFYFFKTV